VFVILRDGITISPPSMSVVPRARVGPSRHPSPCSIPSCPTSYEGLFRCPKSPSPSQLPSSDPIRHPIPSDSDPRPARGLGRQKDGIMCVRPLAGRHHYIDHRCPLSPEQKWDRADNPVRALSHPIRPLARTCSDVRRRKSPSPSNPPIRSRPIPILDPPRVSEDKRWDNVCSSSYETASLYHNHRCPLSPEQE
jgi:hypothetical protein